MRWLFASILFIVTQIGAAWALGEANTARPGGSFSTLETEDAGACEQLCADDGLCMAWTFQGNSCDLKAIVPPAAEQSGAVSGVSPRAPATLRERDASAETAQIAHFSPPDAPLETSAAPVPEDEVSALLLGGPEGDE